MSTSAGQQPAGVHRPLWRGPAQVLTQAIAEAGADEPRLRDQVELSICDVGICSVCGDDSVIFDHYLDAFVHLRECREIAYSLHQMAENLRVLAGHP